MHWSPEEIIRLEDIVTQLAGEIHLAKPNGDEGLLPIFNLVSTFSEDFAKTPFIEEMAKQFQAVIQPMLDEAKLFEKNDIETLKRLSIQLSDSLIAIKQGEEPELPQIETSKPVSIFETPTEEERILEMPSPISFEEPVQDSNSPNSLLPGDKLERFSKLSQQISGELLLADKGSDEGLLPIYSLLKEFEDTFAGVTIILEALQPVSSKMDQLLDSTGIFDESAIRLLTDFNIWLESSFTAFTEGFPPVPFKAPVEAEPAVAEKAIENSADESDLLKEFSEFDIVMDLNMEENQELLVEFHAEAVDHLRQIEEAVLELEQDGTNRDAINSMFRSFHTIKGVAGFLNLIPVNRLAHEVESLMDLVRNDKLSVFTGVIDLVLESKDTIAKQIEQISAALSTGSLPTGIIPVSHYMARARWAMEGPEKYAGHMGQSSPEPETAENEKEADPEIDANADDSISEAATPTAPSAEATKAAKKRAVENASIRVNTWKLDNLMDMVGELVIVQSQIQESAKEHVRENSSLLRNMSQLTRITKDLQHTSMALRMIPIKPTFQKMSRIVRDLSAKSGKKVFFEVSGEDTELDRNVVEEIGDPLVHMIRNSLDHGLEDTEERAQTNKDKTGHVTLKAYHQGSSIVIELSDDGRGIDPKRIFQKAVENGIVREEDQLSNEEIYKLLFAPGFSTAAEITDISGRGVGMDVVKKNIEKLRGKTEIESELGKGSIFRILLPLTMAIVDGLVVKVGADRFILPTTSVKVALRPDAEMMTTIQGNQEVLNLRGKIIPLFRLHDHFQIENAVTDPKKATIVVVETAGRPCGLLVDDMISKQEVVIKSLGSMMQGIQGVSGGAILGDGNIALILDPASLVSAA
jgi:two-component system chemotaxis sensor kinase CheA